MVNGTHFDENGAASRYRCSSHQKLYFNEVWSQAVLVYAVKNADGTYSVAKEGSQELTNEFTTDGNLAIMQALMVRLLQVLKSMDNTLL